MGYYFLDRRYDPNFHGQGRHFESLLANPHSNDFHAFPGISSKHFIIYNY